LMPCHHSVTQLSHTLSGLASTTKTAPETRPRGGAGPSIGGRGSARNESGPARVVDPRRAVSRADACAPPRQSSGDDGRPISPIVVPSYFPARLPSRNQHLINPVAFPAPAPTWSGHQAWHRAPLATPPAFSWCAAASAFCPCSSNWRTYSVHSWRSRLRMSRLILGHISADTAVELESIDQHFRQASFAEFKMLMTFDDEASKRYGLPKSIVEQVLIKVYQCLSKK